MAFKISYKASVSGDLRRLDQPTANRLLSKLERELSRNPNVGIPLTGEFRGLVKYRVGDDRVIYAKGPDGVLVLRIRHRKEVYR